MHYGDARRRGYGSDARIGVSPGTVAEARPLQALTCFCIKKTIINNNLDRSLPARNAHVEQRFRQVSGLAQGYEDRTERSSKLSRPGQTEPE